jgi:hypothetical protein
MVAFALATADVAGVTFALYIGACAIFVHVVGRW